MDTVVFQAEMAQLPIRKSVLRQLKMTHTISLTEAEECEFLCWFYADTLGRGYKRAPVILVHQDSALFLYEPTSFGWSARDRTVLLVRNKEVEQVIIP